MAELAYAADLKSAAHTCTCAEHSKNPAPEAGPLPLEMQCTGEVELLLKAPVSARWTPKKAHPHLWNCCIGRGGKGKKLARLSGPGLATAS
jgi:hypothetical protein